MYKNVYDASKSAPKYIKDLLETGEPVIVDNDITGIKTKTNDMTYKKFKNVLKYSDIELFRTDDNDENDKRITIIKKGSKISKKHFYDICKSNVDKNGCNKLKDDTLVPGERMLLTNHPEHTDSRSTFNGFLNKRENSKIFFYEPNHCNFVWVLNEAYNMLIIELKKKIKKREARCIEENSKSHILVRGIKWFPLAISFDDIDTPDIGSYEIFDILFIGILYYFKGELDRDNALNYLMKYNI